MLGAKKGEKLCAKEGEKPSAKEGAKLGAKSNTQLNTSFSVEFCAIPLAQFMPSNALTFGAKQGANGLLCCTVTSSSYLS
jgi:hypothetical protein